MYYRVATQLDAAPTCRWKSTVLSSLDILFQFLRLLHALPQDQLRVFSSASKEGLAEQLESERVELGRERSGWQEYKCAREAARRVRNWAWRRS